MTGVISNQSTKPTFDLDQIIHQLRASFYEIPGDTRSWASLNPIKYYIGGTPYASSSTERHGLVTMTPLMQGRAALAFELWDDLIARDLDQSHDVIKNQIQFEYSSETKIGHGTYTYNFSSDTSDNEYGTILHHINRAEIWISSTWKEHNTDAAMGYGGYGFTGYLHEIGHSLGLSHPGLYAAVGHADATYEKDALYNRDNRQYTVMSYFGGYEAGIGWRQDGIKNVAYYASTPMVDDISAIQAIYGADMTTRTGDTVYGFNNNTGRDVYSFDPAVSAHPIFAIWDADGTDAIDASGYSADQTITLVAGEYSSVGGMTHNIAIARGVTVENAIGGTGRDGITGNEAGNALSGGDGDDTLAGDAGSDLLLGQTGSDAVRGGEGDDFVSGGFGRDTVLGEAGTDLVFGDDDDDWLDGGDGGDRVHGGSGTDIVFGSAGDDLVFGEDGDDFVGTGAGNDFGSGGFGDDEVHGEGGNDLLFGDDGNDGVYGEDGDDLVYGGTGNDYLTGDAGNDLVRGEDGDDGLSGGAGADTLEGGAGADLLFGNAGDDVLTGGAGADVFAFGPGDGLDRILDFAAGGPEADVIAFNGGIFADFAAVQAASRQDGSDVVIACGAGDALTLAGLQRGSLSAANFAFA